MARVESLTKIFGCPKGIKCELPDSSVEVPIIGPFKTNICDGCGKSVSINDGYDGEKIINSRNPGLVESIAVIVYGFKN